MRKKKATSIELAQFYHDCADAAWSETIDLLKLHFDNHRYFVAKNKDLVSQFPKGGRIAINLAKKRILKVLAKARKESVV